MATRKKGGTDSEKAVQDKATRAKKPLAKGSAGEKKAPVSAKSASASKKTVASKEAAIPKKPSAAKAAATKTVKQAKETATKAVKAVTRKVAKKVSDLTSGRKSAKASATADKAEKAAKSKTPTPKRTVVTSPPAAKKSTRSTAKSGTAVGALGKDITDADVIAALTGAGSSEFTPEDQISDSNPVDVREHYFGEHRPGPPISDQRELPQEYGDTKIVLLVRDPEWLYAYWEINDATRADFNLNRNGHQRRMVIRLYKITDRNWPAEAAHYFQDIDISPYAANWYLKLPEANERWCAELGTFDEQNEFTTICRSNLVDTPRNTISEHTDSEWMIVEENFRKLVGISGNGDISTPGGVTMRGGSEMIIRQLQKAVTGMLRTEVGGLSSGSLYSGSLVAGKVEVEKDFWLKVHTELILYGATEPSARVTVQGKIIRLNEDGTFSVRFTLPDGEQVLHVTAINADGDLTHEVTPVVTKVTK